MKRREGEGRRGQGRQGRGGGKGREESRRSELLYVLMGMHSGAGGGMGGALQAGAECTGGLVFAGLQQSRVTGAQRGEAAEAWGPRGLQGLERTGRW